MTTDNHSFFWDAIRKSNKRGNTDWRKYDVDEHLENLTKLLSKSSREQLIQFEKSLRENINALYTAEIAELSIILENRFTFRNEKIVFEENLSTDGFIYFRCWLLLKGKEFFDEITTDINAFINGKYSFDIADCWAEGLLFVADRAYLVKHPNETEMEIQDAATELFPEVIHYDSLEQKMKGEPVRGDQLQDKYPQLVAEMTQLRAS